jgi:tRNA nucleotidyltransferase/poly(A) polymerase
VTKIDPQIQREFAVDVVAKLRAGGFETYWAGGCVRDQLLGRQPKDYDVATSARPEQIRQLFGQRRTLALGAAFGVITVLGTKQSGQIEVATFRRDADYSDGRHPDTVTFSTPAEDAERRDFTINGLFFDPQASRVIDFVGGEQDLQRGIVRAIGDPLARFREDKLRLLRAVRFAAAFGFEIESATCQAIEQMAGEIHAVSAERIAAELRLILTHANRRRGVALFAEVGLLKAILPEVAAQQTDASQWLSTLQILEALDEPGFPLALAALVHEFGDAALIDSIGTRLKLANSETSRAGWLVANWRSFEQAREMPWPKLQRLLIAPGAGECVALIAARAAVTGEHQADVDYCRTRLALPQADLNPPPLISGNDLITHGIPPGPDYQRFLERVRDEQLEKRVASREAALELVDRLRAETPHK